MARQRRPDQRVARLLVACGLALAALPVASRGAVAEQAIGRFESVDEAVAAGVVDPALAEAVRSRTGPVEAMVNLERTEALAAATRHATPAGRISAFGDALDSARAEVAVDAEIVADLPDLSVVPVRIRDERRLLRLVNRRAVRSVGLDAEVTAAADQSLPLIRQPELIQTGVTGAGVAIAILDHGVDWTTPEFGSCTGPGSPGCRVAVSEDVAVDDGLRDHPSRHGTAVSAIVSRTAPGAALLVFDVFGPCGALSGCGTSSSTLAAGIQRVLTYKAQGFDIRAVNLSLSGSFQTCTPAADFGLADAVFAGVVPVVAAGNNGRGDALPWPSCLDAALSVGATSDSAGTSPCGAIALDQVTCYSNSGPALDVLAPGSIIAAGGVTVGHGTSYAAPHVSGAVALLAQGNGWAEPEHLRAALESAGPVVVDPRNAIGRRRLDVSAARERLPSAGARPWASLGGVVVGEPDVSAWGPGRLDVFVRGTDDALWHRWWDGVAWRGWESLGGVLTSSPTAVSWGPNRVDVFARGTDGGLWQRAWTGTAWTGWFALGGQLSGSPDVASWGPGRLDVFVSGTDGALWQRFWNGTAWSSWISLGGALASGPGSASWGAGRLDVFASGTDSQLWHRFYAGRWSHWEPLGGVLSGDADVASMAPGRLDVLVPAPDGRLRQLSHAGQWQPWRGVDGQQVGSGPGIVSWGANRIDAFVRGTDGSLWHRFWDGASW